MTAERCGRGGRDSLPLLRFVWPRPSQEPLSSSFVLDTETDGKSIYVRLGNLEKFSDHVKQLHAAANSTEGARLSIVSEGRSGRG